MNISPGFSGVDVIEIVYDIYAISNSGPPRDAYEGSNKMIVLTRSEPSNNMHRFYAVRLAPTLFGGWALVARGRIGSPGTIKQQIFEDQGIAHAALAANRLAAKTRGLSRCPFWEIRVVSAGELLDRITLEM